MVHRQQYIKSLRISTRHSVFIIKYQTRMTRAYHISIIIIAMNRSSEFCEYFIHKSNASHRRNNCSDKFCSFLLCHRYCAPSNVYYRLSVVIRVYVELYNWVLHSVNHVTVLYYTQIHVYVLPTRLNI